MWQMSLLLIRMATNLLLHQIPMTIMCTPAAFLQDTFTNSRQKNGGRLLQATGSSQHDNRCLQQPKKRADRGKTKGLQNQLKVDFCALFSCIQCVGSSTSDATCLQHPRKRGGRRKEKVAEESGNCDLPGGMCPVVGSSQQRQECVHPTNNIITPNVQLHNSHSQPQTDNQQLSLSQRKETQKRNRDLQQFSTRRIRQRSSEPHVHTTGEPQATETEATCVRTDALPDDPQTAAYTNRRSRRTRRQRILMQHFQSSLHSPANAREEGSSSCTQQGEFPPYDDLGDCTQRCPYCGASFWFGERLMSNGLQSGPPRYRLCCGGGRVFMEPEIDPPEYIKQLLGNTLPTGKKCKRGCSLEEYWNLDN
ncbi:DNA helicase [Artemisia annua]|uniref:DNA helicase n=1 Tax=Artemisia annua TaxID=35608 RepID=A0A2U1QEZ6_ARTAN|nr:DNA helicase [Artemisia annua]